MRFFDFFRKKPKEAGSSVQKTTMNMVPETLVTISTPKLSTTEELDADIIPVEIRVKSAIASRRGLFPHEILLLDYADTFYTSDNTFQGFWWYRYGISNVQVILDSLMERGFLKIGDLRSVLDRETVVSIKEILKTRAIKTTGKKVELIQRTLDEVPEEELNRLFPNRTYCLTELGKIALKEEEYIPYIHEHSIEGLDIWSLNRLVYAEPHMKYRDKIWNYLNQQSIKHFSEHNFGLYRNCRLAMSRCLKEEDRQKELLDMLTEVAFYDLSGCGNGFDFQFLEIYAQHFFPYENSLVTIAPAVIKEIAQCQENIGISDNELKDGMKEHMLRLSAPLQLFSVDECIQIVLLERDKDIEELKKVYANAKRNFKKKYPGMILK